jgi:hypothetical protein
MLESGSGTGECVAWTRAAATKAGHLGRLIGEHRNPRFRNHQKQETRRELMLAAGFSWLQRAFFTVELSRVVRPVGV